MKRRILAAALILQSCALMEKSAPPADRKAEAAQSTPDRDHDGVVDGLGEVLMVQPTPDAPKKPKPDRKTKTGVDFQDDLVEGDLTKPDGESVGARNKTAFKSMIKVRDNFDPNLPTTPPAADPGPKNNQPAKAPDKPAGGDDGRFAENRNENREATETGVLLQHYGVNPTIDTAAERVSTFAADVDTGSYTLARGYLEREQLPPEAAVRVEEFVNAFDYGYRPPEREAFAVQVEAFPSPYRKGYHVLHVGMKGREVKAEARKSANLVFVIDVSGSMDAQNRLPMAKDAMRMLVDQLREDDTVAIVVYGSTAHTVLEPTSAAQRRTIYAALDSLRSEGSTNVQAGLELGYTVALKRFKGGGINRVILCSDGVANNGITQADGIFARVKGKASEGITLTTVGFGMGSYNDVLMERLADQGDGHYAYVDKLEEARRIFVEQLTGTLEVIAKDVKLQLEFNPEAVERYRLLGFENRSLKKEDFANDRVDAGELGAGHSVTAIYEVKFRSRSPKSFATFRARYKQPQGGQSALVEKALPMEVVRDSVMASTGPTRLSLVAAGFAEKLRGSYWARNLSWDELLAQWETLPQQLKERKQTQELRTLILAARRLDKRPDRWESEMPLAQMDFDRIPVLR